MMGKIQQFHRRENVLSLLPILELVGQRRLLIENHQGVLSYAPDEIKIKVSYGCITVVGNELQLMEMSRVKLAICGRIDTLQIFGR